MPTLVGARRRGFTPEGFRLFAERIGVSKSDSWIDMSVLEDCMRDDLNARAQRRIAVLDPVRLVIDNYPEGESEECFAPNHPQQPELGQARAAVHARALDRARRLSGDAAEGLLPPRAGRRGAAALRATSSAASAPTRTPTATSRPSTARTIRRRAAARAGADARKVKGNIHWLSAAHAVPAEVRLYDRLFAVPFPGARNPRGHARRQRRRELASRATRRSSPATTTTRTSSRSSATTSTTSIRSRSA